MPILGAFGNDNVHIAGPRMYSPGTGKQWGELVTPRSISRVYTPSRRARLGQCSNLWASEIRAFLCKLYAGYGDSKSTQQHWIIHLNRYIDFLSTWYPWEQYVEAERQRAPYSAYLSTARLYIVSLWVKPARTLRRQARILMSLSCGCSRLIMCSGSHDSPE